MQILQREHGDGQVRFALVGLAFPEDRGDELAIVQGHALRQAHGELIADASLGVSIGEVLRLGRDDYRVVGLTSQLLGSGGDAACEIRDGPRAESPAATSARRDGLFAPSARSLATARSSPAMPAEVHMLFRQLFDKETSTYTYLVADEVTKEAALIDPVLEQLERDLEIVR